MSIGLGRSYQHVGINRVGEYMKPAKEKGPSADSNVCSTISRPNEIWRRYTGIFEGKKISPEERKRGLRILARKISERVRRNFTAEAQRPGEGQKHGVTGRDARTTGLAAGSEPRTVASGGLEISLVSDWDFDSATWTRVANCGVTVEALCVELGCTRSRLTSLLKEYCGMSAPEFVDGVKFSRLKSAMMLRLREAATELWGFPGSYVAVKLCSERRAESLLCDPDLTPRPPSLRGKGENGGGGRCAVGKRSRFFRTRAEELFEESRGDERVRRIWELCDMLRRDFHLESWAISLGYENGAKLKRACLNVLGRTLEKLERGLAMEVVQFYFCAEDRQLREIALRDDGSVITGRARELYHGDDAKPEEPFVDEYAKFEELKAEWLSRMWNNFNGNKQ